MCNFGELVEVVAVEAEAPQAEARVEVVPLVAAVPVAEQEPS